MGCDDQPRRWRLSRREIVERPHILRAALEVQQQHMASLDCPLDAGDQHDAALGGVGDQPPDVQLPVVQRDRQGVVAQRRGAIDQLGGAVRDPIDRIVGCVGVQVNLQHREPFSYRMRASDIASPRDPSRRCHTATKREPATT